MFTRTIFAFFLLFLLIGSRRAAAQPGSVTPDSTRSAANGPMARNLLEAFQKGHFYGHFRSFFMATDNARQLTDYYAWAAGGGLHFNTAPFHGFQFGLGGAFNFNLASSDLGARDPGTNAANRYEIGLFDIENPYNRRDLDRMEELWLRYNRKWGTITLGQQSLQTPFINSQDGRMRATQETGLWASVNASANTRIEGGWLWAISPRSTVRWYSIGTSIGLYPKGLNPDGSASGYPENLRSKGVGLLGITQRINEHLRVQVWDQYVDHIFHTAFAQADYTYPLANRHQLLVGLQYTHQDALGSGGNDDPAKSYFPKDGHSNVLSTQAGWHKGAWQTLLAYTRVAQTGRFLTPREWGREPFYTFITRERIEGSGDSHSVSGRISWQNAKNNLRLEAAYGHFYLPDIHNTAMNKYAFPAYRQFDLDARYTFSGAWKGLRAQLLYVYKWRLGNVYGNDKYVINRVDMAQYNLVLNYVY